MSDSILQSVVDDKRGGSSELECKIFGVDCNLEFAEVVASDLVGVSVDFDGENSILGLLPVFEEKHVFDLRSEIDSIYGEDVCQVLEILGVKLTSPIICGCGKLGAVSSTEFPSMVCKHMTKECKVVSAHEYQDLQPNVVARAAGLMLGNVSLGTNYRFIEMLGALAGYPFKCGCGNPVTCLDAPQTSCDFCVATDGQSFFTKHMDAEQYDPAEPSFIQKMCEKIKGKASTTGSYVYSLITELITTVGNYFNSVFQHYGEEFFDGMKTGFTDAIRSLAAKLKAALGSEGFLFLFVTVIVAVIIRFGAEMVANFIISSTLSLFEMLKGVAGEVFGGFTTIYKTIVDRLRSGREEDDSFVKHSSSFDGCTAMIATLFCTFASASGTVGSTKILRSISSARHVLSGVQVAKSALLWLVENLPSALQTFLWDATGVGSFECQDEELMQLIVSMRESLLSLRKHPTVFLADQQSCKLLLTAHTMLTRAVTRNTHGWNPTQNSILRAMLTESKDYIARAQACVDKGIGRIEPVGLILQGPPGIGKTALIEVLAAKINPDVPRCSRIYYKNLREKFWSGYSEHPVLVLDDYGAVKDDTAEAGLAADMLRIISPGEMALDMPFDKGVVFCKSNLVIVTTNRDMNSPQKFLESNKAFMRRFLYCTVSLKEEFKTANGLLDTAKLRQLPLKDSISFPHLNFRVHEKFSTGNEAAGLYTLSQQDRSLEEVSTILTAHMLKKTCDATFLNDAANQVAPVVENTKVHVELKEAIKEQLPDDFVKHMEPGYQHKDGVDYDIKHDLETAELFVGELVREAMDDMEVDEYPVYRAPSSAFAEMMESDSLGSQKPKYGKTSGGNRPGINARRKKDALFMEQRAKASQQQPYIDEFGIPWESPDLAIRASAYLDSCARPDFVKVSSLKAETERFKRVITDAAMEVMSKVKGSPLKCMAGVAACATTIALCLKAFKMFTEPAHESQMRTGYNRDHVRRRPDIANRGRYVPMTKHSLDSDTDKAVIAKISANCGYLERKGGKVGCFFVEGNVFRTVTHFFRTDATDDRWLPNGTPFSVFARDGDKMVEHKMAFSMDFVIPFEDDDGLISDWLYYGCGTKVPPKKSMVNLHLTEKFFTHRRAFQSVLMVRTDGVSKGACGTVRHIAGSPAVQYSSVDGSKKPDVYVPRAILSNYDCDYGDCGYPIISKVDGQYKILSLHVGVRSKPFSTEATSAIVTVSEVNTCLEIINASFPITKHASLENVSESKPAVVLNDAFTYCGKLDWAPNGISSNTKYRRSLIYDHLDKTLVYEPSIMGHPDDVRTSKTPKQVLADIANRADPLLGVMPQNLVRLAGDALFESVISEIPATPDATIRTLTLKEALNGDNRFVDRYPTAGSPGIPSTIGRKHGVTGKHGIMDRDANGDWFISDSDCAQRIADMHDSFSEGIVPPYFNQFCIKDETLKCDAFGKVKKTRGIKCAPIESNLCGKRYFGGMVGLFKKFHDRIPFKCGMNVFSSDWDYLMKWHLEVGDIGFDGDIGGQENMIKGEIYDELYRFTDRIYAHYGEQPTSEERRQRASYLASLCHYYMVIGPDLFRAKFGNPSGNWLTAFICSFASGILLGVAYFGLAFQHDPMKANVYSYLSLVRTSLCGDDNFVSRSALLDWFTGANVSKFLEENFGYKYTDAKKAAVFPPDRPVIELNFLACNTRLSDEYAGITYMACIDEGPLEKCVQYVSKKAASGDEYVAIVDNANTALDMAFTSGKERFTAYREKYRKAFIDAPDCHVPLLHDFAFCEERFLTKELLSEDYFADDYLFLPHMLKSPEQVQPEFDDAQVSVEAGVGNPPDSQVTYKCTEKTVLEPSKRFSAMYDSPAATSPVPSYQESVSGAFVTRDTSTGAYRPMAGTLAWFAGPFAAWSGDLRFGFKCAGEIIIRADATERLANAGSAPRQIPKDISSMCPFDYTSVDEKWAMLQFPATVPYKFMVLPKLPGEDKYRQTTSASYVVDTPQGVDRPPLTVFAAAGDNFTTHFLYMVPSIKIRGSYYPHNRNYQDTLPEYLSLTNVSGAPTFPFDQASVIQNHKEQGVVDSNGTTIISVNYRTEIFSDAELIALGVVTVAPTNRRYDPGAVRKVNCDLSNCVARSVSIEVSPGGNSTGAVAYNLDPTIAFVRGTSYVSTPGGVEMARGWYLSYFAYANSLVRSGLNSTGIPATEIVIPTAQSGYEHSPSESFIRPTTNTGLPYLGGNYFLWDSTTTFPKAFYDTPILPFKEDEKVDSCGYTFVKHMDSDHGIGFTSVVGAPAVSTDRKPKVARKQMGEEDYSFGSFVDRFQLVRSFDWNESQVQGTILDSRSVPYQCIGSTTQDAFNKFCYWSGDVEMKIQVQSTAFVCGKLSIVFAPFCDPARASALQLPSLVSISVAPNVTIMAGNTTEVSFLIPYAHYKNYLNTDGEAGDPFSLLGTVSVVVFNKLRVASGGVDYCTVNLYTRFRNSNFQMLRPPPIDGNVSNFVKHGGTVSKNVSGVIDDVTDAVSKVGDVVEYALDAPNVGANYFPIFKRAAPMLNHSTNVHYANVMDMHPGQKSLADQKDVASTVPECTIKHLLTKPSFVNTFTIKGGDLEGEVYMVIPLTPTMKLFNAPPNSLVDETLMGYVAAPFKYWRGGFKFIIEVIATSVHTARLVVATHYGGASSTVSMDNIMAQNAQVLEIGAGRNTFEVSVPWRVPTQWLEVPCGPPENVNPFEVTSSARYTMGELSIRLLTRLQTMPSVTPDIDCNVYVSMLDDAELAYIGMNSADLVPVMVPNQKIVP